MLFAGHDSIQLAGDANARNDVSAMSAGHSGCNRRRRAGCGNAGRGLSGPRQSQALFPVEPVNALAVHRVALPSQEHKQAPATKPPSLMRQGPEPFPKGSIVGIARPDSARWPGRSQ
jgi:hypothetical protein